MCPRDLNFGLPGKKKDVDREARFLRGRRMDGEVWGFGRHCAMTEKVHLEDLIPLTTESSDEMRGGEGLSRGKLRVSEVG